MPHERLTGELRKLATLLSAASTSLEVIAEELERTELPPQEAGATRDASCARRDGDGRAAHLGAASRGARRQRSSLG
jgi:hypothetical protein